MLTIIENDQGFLVPQIIAQCSERCAGLLANANGRKDGLGNQVRICKRRQLDEPDPVRKLIYQIRGDLQGKARLARPARTYQRDKVADLEFPFDLGQLAFTPDKAGKLDRKIV